MLGSDGGSRGELRERAKRPPACMIKNSNITGHKVAAWTISALLLSNGPIYRDLPSRQCEILLLEKFCGNARFDDA